MVLVFVFISEPVWWLALFFYVYWFEFKGTVFNIAWFSNLPIPMNMGIAIFRLCRQSRRPLTQMLTDLPLKNLVLLTALRFNCYGHVGVFKFRSLHRCCRTLVVLALGLGLPATMAAATEDFLVQVWHSGAATRRGVDGHQPAGHERHRMSAATQGHLS
jgi:hypothetical protein